MLDILLDCLSETWLILLFFAMFVVLAKYDEHKRKKPKWSRDSLSMRNGDICNAARKQN